MNYWRDLRGKINIVRFPGFWLEQLDGWWFVFEMGTVGRGVGLVKENDDFDVEHDDFSGCRHPSRDI